MSTIGARNPSSPQPPATTATRPTATSGAAPAAPPAGSASPSRYSDSFERAQPAHVGSAPAFAAAAVGPGSGQAIQAKVTQPPGQGDKRLQFEFDRPLTQEQAAQVMFQGGKVPDGAKLVPGQGPNTWILETASADALMGALQKMNSRTETKDYTKRDEFVMSWSGAANKVSTGPRRLDLQNDFGFVVTKNFPLDQGKIPEDHVKSRIGNGTGYEVAFEKPMTKKEVMDKLFDQSKFQAGDVQLVPVGGPPSMTWRIQVVGPDALSDGFKHPFGRAFIDSNNHAKPSLNPGIPAGMKAHFENKTLPQDARKVGPNTYVWEQEGHIAHVVTDGKGHYSHEFTKLHPTEEKFNNTIRYFMLEKGLPPRKGWQAFSKHWDEIHQQMAMAMLQMLEMMAGGRAGRMPGKLPAGGVRIDAGTAVRRQPGLARQPGVRTGGTLPGNPPPMPKGAGRPGNVAATTRQDVGKTMTADPGRARTQPSATQPDHGKTMTADPARAQTQPGGANAAGKDTVQSVDTSGPSARPARSGSKGYGKVVPGWKIRKTLPDSQKVTIQTPNGPRSTTVGEYRQRHARAKEWMAGQLQEYHRQTRYTRVGTYPPNFDDLAKQAQRKFDLDPFWYTAGNPYLE